MKYRFFHIPALGGEELEQVLNDFCSQNKIAAVEKEFVTDGARSFWSICISYLDTGQKTSDSYKKSKIDYREVLNEQDFALFAKLRALRKTLAERDGVPAYALFTNEQLAAMVERRITDVPGLDQINGVGKSRQEKYGSAFIEVIKAFNEGTKSNSVS